MIASELRIGNWIAAKDFDRPFQVAANTFIEMIQLQIADESVHEPIPLTEEWLLKFGFLAPVGEYEGFKLSGDYMSMSVFLLERNEIYAMDGSDSLLVKGIRYVHQLQNLYFALTGEELTIKE